MNTPLALHINKTVIVGSPNVGKSQLFSKLSKRYSLVANYPNTTLKGKRAPMVLDEMTFELIDTPGINSLAVTSEEELITRNILLTEHPELMIQCADATNLERSLLLYLQLKELDIPFIFCLTMRDEARKKRIEISETLLEEELGLPVIGNDTLAEAQTTSFKNALLRAPKPSSVGYLQYPERIEATLRELHACFPEGRKPSRGLLLLFIKEDEGISDIIERKYGKEIKEKTDTILKERKKSLGSNMREAIAKARQVWVNRVMKKCVHTEKTERNDLLERFGWASRHPVWGWPIMVVILTLLYLLVGDVSQWMSSLFDLYLFAPLQGVVESLVSDPLYQDILIGDYGILTMGIMNAIGTVVPILLLFFFLLSFLEDLGYLPNLSVLSSRMLQHIGLNGKAAMSIILALGCNTMATLTTRLLPSKKERTIAIFIIALGIPCSVQLGVMLAILSSIHLSGLFIVFGTVLVLQVVAALILNRIIPVDQTPHFLIELPPTRLPVMKNVLLKTYLRMKWFLIEALPLFIYSAVFLLTLKYTGLLDLIRTLLSPVVESFLNLPSNAVEMFIMVLSRREVGAILFKNMVDSGQVDFIQTVVGLTVITLFVPCMSNTMVMFRELGVLKSLLMTGVILFLAIMVGGIMNMVLRTILL